MIDEQILKKLEEAKKERDLYIDFEVTREIFDEILEIDRLTFIRVKNEINSVFYFGYEGKEDQFSLQGKFIKNQENIFSNNSILTFKHNYSLTFFYNKSSFGFISYKKRFLLERNIYCPYFMCYIFGTHNNNLKVFKILNNSFNNWSEKIKEKLLLEFYYPEINRCFFYDELIKLKKEKKNTYLIHDLKKRIPVNDLLKHIGEENIEFEPEAWKGKNHLTKIKLENFKNLKEFELELFEGVNIILAHNGFGKTSILQAITWALLALKTKPEEKPATWKKYIQFNQEDARISLFWGEETKRIRYIFPEEIQENQYLELPKQILLSYGVSFNTSKYLSHSEIERDLVSGEAVFYSTHSIFKDHSEHFFDPVILLQDLPTGANATAENLPKIHQIMNLIKNTINEYLALVDENEKIQLTGEGSYFYFEDTDKHQLQIENLSEGYRDHVLLITDIIVKIIASRKNIFDNKEPKISKNLFTNVKGTILIDEFDRHLHPSWQHKFLPKLKKDFPNIQFILTTHNPISLQSAVGANAIQLYKEGNQILAKNSKIEVKNILSILSQYFTKNVFDDTTQKQLNEFSNYMDRINDDGEIELVYSEEFKILVKNLSAINDEIKDMMTIPLLQLNSVLKTLGKKEFQL